MKYILSLLLVICFVGCKNIMLSIGLRPVIDGGEIPKINSQIKNINAGGCGFFALLLYERLDTSEYKIVSIRHLNHICILENRTGSLIDSDGYHDRLAMNLKYNTSDISEISLDSLRYLVYKDKNWNKTFNWKDTSVIKSFIKSL